MSVIAYRDGVLAADMQLSSNGLILKTEKIWLLESGEILAGNGALANVLMLKQWYEEGAEQSKYPDFQKTDEWVELIVLNKDGCFYYQKHPAKMKVYDQFTAWGSGRELAIGAMAMGADATKAVEIACQFDDACGVGLSFYRFLQSPEPNFDGE